MMSSIPGHMLPGCRLVYIPEHATERLCMHVLTLVVLTIVISVLQLESCHSVSNCGSPSDS